IQHRDAGPVEPAHWDPAEDTAVLEARAVIARGRSRTGTLRQIRRRIVDVVEEIAVVVERLREVAVTLEIGRQPIVLNGSAGRARTIFVGVEEEQLVVAALLADGAADRVTPVTFLVDVLRVAVPLIRPTVRVPIRVPLVIVEAAAILVGAPTGDGR